MQKANRLIITFIISATFFMHRCHIPSFMPEGNSPTINDLLNALYNFNKYMSALTFIIFVGISESWDALETSRIKNSFLHLNLYILKGKLPIRFFSFIGTTLGWFLYCSIIRKVGSSMWSIFTDGSTNGGIFKFETAKNSKEIIESLRNFIIIL